MKRMFILISGLLLLGSQAFADAASKQALADQLMVVMDVRGQLLKSMEVLKQSLPGQMGKIRPAPGAPDSSTNHEDVLDKTLDALFAGPEWEQVQQEMAGIYADVFSEAELKGLNEFYASPIGKAYLSKQPEIMQKSMAVNQRVMMNILPRLKEIMRAPRPTPADPAAP